MMNSTQTLVSSEDIAHYRQKGFVRVAGIISREEAEEFRLASLEAARRRETAQKRAVFTQLVNLWREDETMRRLTMHPNVAQAATQLAGKPLRLWHDQALIKLPHNNAATHFHQDQPYWPHENKLQMNPISCWIALCDVPVERGCMTFLPGSHSLELPPQNLNSATSLFSLRPDLQWQERVTLPLQAGDCTFHHGRCAHMATPNETDEPRVAHVVIFMDEDTRYNGVRHVVTDPLGLADGAPLDGEMFPPANI